MSTLRIPENVLEAFKREFWASAQIGEPEVRSIESGLQAALAEWGATPEYCAVYDREGAVGLWTAPQESVEKAREQVPTRRVIKRIVYRLRLPWTPVDGGQ